MKKIKNIFGWMIFFIGLAIIFWAIFNSYNIFTGKAKVPDVFKVTTEKTTSEKITSTKGKIPTTQAEIEKEIENVVSEQLKVLLPVETIFQLFNLIAWAIFAGILFFGGAQIASLGIKLIKI